MYTQTRELRATLYWIARDYFRWCILLGISHWFSQQLKEPLHTTTIVTGNVTGKHVVYTSWHCWPFAAVVCCFAVTGPVFIVLRTTPREMALIVDAKRGGGDRLSYSFSCPNTRLLYIHAVYSPLSCIIIWMAEERLGHTHRDYIYCST